MVEKDAGNVKGGEARAKLKKGGAREQERRREV